MFAPGIVPGNSGRLSQGRFNHAGKEYLFWATNPIHEQRYLAEFDGTYEIGICHFTFSLGEP